MVQDLDPTEPAARTWTTTTFALLWCSVCIQPFGVVAGGSLISLGLSWPDVVLAVTLGTVVLMPCLIANAVAGVKYGVPFPVLCRSSFGVRGAQAAALSRGIVAMGWLSIQLWFGATALYEGLHSIWPSVEHPSVGTDINLAQLLLFLGYVGLHCICVILGLEKLEPILKRAAIAQAVGLLALCIWALCTEPLVKSLEATNKLRPAQTNSSSTLMLLADATTSSVAGWSTLTLNIADLSRYAKNQRSSWLGQLLGFPAANIITPFVGIIVTGAAYLHYGVNSWDLVTLFGQWRTAVGVPASILIACSSLACNVVANIVSPANDIANLAPKSISFRMGALITLAIATCMCPWRIFSSANNLVTRFLVGYSMVTGSILAVMLVDYYIVHKQNMNVHHLYDLQPGSPYWFTAGFNWRAGVAVVLGISLCFPGFLAELGAIHVGQTLNIAYKLSWFVSFFLTGFLYAVLNAVFPAAIQQDHSKRSEDQKLLSEYLVND